MGERERVDGVTGGRRYQRILNVENVLRRTGGGWG